MLIKVFGPGCARCKEVENVVAAAMQEAGSAAIMEKVTDLKEMMELGVMFTPAVAIDNKVMCTGRVPSRSEVMNWIAAPDAKVPVRATSADCCCCGSKC